MKKFLLAALTVLFLTFPAFAADKPQESTYDRVMRTGVLRCGYYPWPPSFILDVNTGKVSGWAAEYAKAIGDLLGLKVEFVQMTGAGLQIEDMKKGLYDTYCTDSYYTFSTIKWLDFGTPFYFIPVFVYVRSDDVRFNVLTDLNSPEATFVGMDGDISVEMARRRFPKAKLRSLPATSDATQLLMDVFTKKADGAIVDAGLADSFSKSNPPGLKIVDIDHPVAVYPISFSVLKGEASLLNMLNGATSALYNTGGAEMILKSYNLPAHSLYLPAKAYLPDK